MGQHDQLWNEWEENGIKLSDIPEAECARQFVLFDKKLNALKGGLIAVIETMERVDARTKACTALVQKIFIAVFVACLTVIGGIIIASVT